MTAELEALANEFLEALAEEKVIEMKRVQNIQRVKAARAAIRTQLEGKQAVVAAGYVFTPNKHVSWDVDVHKLG